MHYMRGPGGAGSILPQSQDDPLAAAGEADTPGALPPQWVTGAGTPA